MRQERNVAEFCAEIFDCLPRSDQRRKGKEYVNGLLQTRGRKSIRNIAGTSDGSGAEQALHHFVNDSTWDWVPVRRALADHVHRVAAPEAWVLRPMMIPKTGAQTIGVARHFCPSLRHSLNAQHAVGLWAGAAGRFVTPVNWRLHLSREWLADAERRRRALIPDGTVAQDLGTCAVDTYLQLAGPHRAPVVLDAREMDAESVVRRLGAAGATVLVRVPDALKLTAYPGTAKEITGPAGLVVDPRHGQCPVFGWPHGGVGRAGLLPVRLPGSPRRAALQLLSVGPARGPWPGESWLTDITGRSLADLVRLTGLPRQVDDDLGAFGDRVGLRDFSGRSLTGWHRHTTLASAAHALLALDGVPEPALSRA
jgi:hypothetical protein